MDVGHVLKAWKAILAGREPSLSLEITRECPLRCPGCYAYDDNHLGGTTTLRQLSDFKGEELIRRALEVVDREKPLHVSLVGGDPLVRYRELEVIVAKLLERGIHVQVVTSAFREIPAAWKGVPKLNVSVSIDGLQPEHDARRKPATYERILKSIAGHKITVHCTITSQMTRRSGYLDEFLTFWSAREEVSKIWFSLFTPQIGDQLEEILTPEDREAVVKQLLTVRERFPKADMPPRLVKQYLTPPSSPKDCIFAMTTKTISADLRTVIQPCQFGGEPDCSQCGCYASMGLAAIGDHRLGGMIRVHSLFATSHRIGKLLAPKSEETAKTPPELISIAAPPK